MPSRKRFLSFIPIQLWGLALVVNFVISSSAQSMMLRYYPLSARTINRGDFNNDGILDIVADNGSVFLGTGNGGFQQPTSRVD